MKNLFIAAALTTMMGAAHAGNLVVDGSFEDHAQASGTWDVYSTLPGWTTVSGSGIELRNDVAGSAFDGHNFVELDSYNNSAMSQTLLTDAGKAYTVSFAYSARAGVSAASNPIEVLWNGHNIATVTSSGIGHSGNEWHLYSYDVQGLGHDKLTFRAGGINDSLGGSLDAVSVTAAIPEPSTWALMIGGFALIGLNLGRRRGAR